MTVDFNIYLALFFKNYISKRNIKKLQTDLVTSMKHINYIFLYIFYFYSYLFSRS